MQAEPSEDAVDIFLAAFNASQPAYVTELLARALTRDVVFWGPLGRSVGVEAVEEFITELRAHPEGPGAVTRTTVVDAPGEWARYSWSYRNEEGRVLLTGTDMVHLREGGSIRWSSSPETWQRSERGEAGAGHATRASPAPAPSHGKGRGPYSSSPVRTITRSYV